jgi:hypothetical protein
MPLEKGTRFLTARRQQDLEMVTFEHALHCPPNGGLIVHDQYALVHHAL